MTYILKTLRLSQENSNLHSLAGIVFPALLILAPPVVAQPALAEEASQPALTEICQGKKIIGEIARITVNEANINYLARIDTGAKKTSLHAFDIKIANGSKKQKKNIGKKITFTTENENNERSKITTTIINVVRVRNAQGTEYRYEVELNLNWRGFAKVNRVNLRDRSGMTYKLLIGRNWLSNDFVVDVDK